MDLSSGGYKLRFLPPSKQSKISNEVIATFSDVSQVVFYRIGNKEGSQSSSLKSIYTV